MNHYNGLDDLEKQLNSIRLAYSSGPSSSPPIGIRPFKFNIGDKVQHVAFGYNAVVIRKIIIEDADSVENYYDVGVWQSMPPTEGQNIPENQLKEGHRIE